MNKVRYAGCVAVLLALTAFSVRAATGVKGEKSVILRYAQDAYMLGPHLDLLEDPSGDLTIEDITAPEYAGQFVPSQKEIPNFGYTDAAIWVRVHLLNASVRQDKWYLELGFANMQHISLYHPRPDAPGFEEHRTGTLLPFSTRDVPYHRFVFIVSLPPGNQETLYLRLKSEAAIPVALTLWSPEKFTSASQHSLFVEGLFLGVLSIMIGYNLVVGIFLREKSYLYYVLFLLSSTMYRVSLEGLGSQYLWPDIPGINSYAVLVSGLLILFAAQLFTIDFLETKRQSPRLHRSLTWFLIAWVAVACQLPFVRYGVMIREMNLLAPFGFILLLTVGIVTWLNGYRPARYYVFAWSVLWIGILLIVLSYTRLLPFISVTKYGFQIGMVLVVWLLSLALADRINLYRREKESAQKRALQTSQENERLVREHNIRLEHTVAERTAELSRAKETAEEAQHAAEEAQKSSEAAQHAAEAANRAKSLFLANMSHELRTPMNAILGFTQLMQRDAALTGMRQEHLDTIMRSGEHLLRLINDVLDMSKIETGHIALNLDTCDLRQTLLGIEEMIGVRAQKKGLQFTVTQAPEVPRYIRTDESKLRQILVNLLGNAIKFTKQGDVTLRVEMHGRASLQFHISDTGIGIAADELESIFEIFVRARQSERATEGTGLGLAISRQFVNLMGGDITVASEPSQGSTFIFTVPVEVVHASVQHPAHETRRVVHIASGQPTILIAEDFDASREFLAQLLQSVGLLVLEARDGREAVTQWQQQQPDLIFMDMRMPVMDGYEATREIRSLEAEKVRGSESGEEEKDHHTAIIALTASAFKEEHPKILDAGCQEVLRKPVKEHVIFDTLHTYLGVEYIYKSDENLQANRARCEKEEAAMPLTPETLAALPPELLHSLEQAAAQVNVKRVEAAIASVRHYNASIADGLANLAKDFKYQDIWKMIQQVKHG